MKFGTEQDLSMESVVEEKTKKCYANVLWSKKKMFEYYWIFIMRNPGFHPSSSSSVKHLTPSLWGLVWAEEHQLTVTEHGGGNDDGASDADSDLITR